jgi:RES domain-containing protein
MTVYRCTLIKWARDLTGTGAFLYGGRWNNPGTHLLYTTENNVLAALEVALRVPLDHIGKNYVMIPIEVPDASDIFIPKLSKNWYNDLKLTRMIGDGFAKNKNQFIMKVPSALISDAYNYIINPNHELIKKVKTAEARSILFDKRLMEMIRSKPVK